MSAPDDLHNGQPVGFHFRACRSHLVHGVLHPIYAEEDYRDAERSESKKAQIKAGILRQALIPVFLEIASSGKIRK